MKQHSDEWIRDHLYADNERDRNIAWNYLYETYYSKLYTSAYRKYKIDEDAYKDCFQMALVALERKARHKTIDLAVGPIGGFLWRVTDFSIQKLFRDDEKKKAEQDINDLKLGNDFFRLLEASEAGRELNSHLKRLNHKCQKILKLFYFERYSMESIANVLELKSERAAITAKLRCLQELRKYY